ncbi:hypothetical protein BD560DRAFT_394897 [Blakeslea trispora]|nr:hypothetical protein BD560DRAFT_394897 [Blakeslea trispora]
MIHILLVYVFGTLSSSVSAIPHTTSLCLDSNYESFVNTSIDTHKWNACRWSHQDALFDQGNPYFRFAQLEHDSAQKEIPESARFDITFRCQHVSEDICKKAENAFKKAGQIISDVVLFREPVRVNATLVSFCAVGNECGKKMMTLGGSSPARAMPLLSNDGLLRLYPQALVKQFGLADHPAYASYDILSVFNADAPFWFEEDDTPISSNEADFTFVVLHEFMHGLGFYSGWNQYISSNALTPDPSPFLANQLLSLMNPITNIVHPSQFLESAMDKFIGVLEQNHDKTLAGSHHMISDLTRHLNRIQASSLAELTASSDFLVAKDMYQHSITPGSLGVFISTEEPLLLETGLDPFQPGSSISHVSFEKYTNTPDFLMRFMQDRGLSLTSAIERGGGNGPIGPLLLRVLEQLGYSTTKNPEVIPPLLIFQNDINMSIKESTRANGGLKQHTNQSDPKESSTHKIQFTASHISFSVFSLVIQYLFLHFF